MVGRCVSGRNEYMSQCHFRGTCVATTGRRVNNKVGTGLPSKALCIHFPEPWQAEGSRQIGVDHFSMSIFSRSRREAALRSAGRAGCWNEVIGAKTLCIAYFLYRWLKRFQGTSTGGRSSLIGQIPAKRFSQVSSRDIVAGLFSNPLPQAQSTIPLYTLYIGI